MNALFIFYCQIYFKAIFRKSLSSAVFLHQALLEAQERDELHLEYFGPYSNHGRRITFHQSLLNYMERVEQRRAMEVYPHDLCTKACKKRGCGRLYVADGNWKLHYPICMFTSKPTARGLDKFVPPSAPSPL